MGAANSKFAKDLARLVKSVYPPMIEGVEAMRDHHHSLVLKLAARLLLTELKLFQHEREGAS